MSIGLIDDFKNQIKKVGHGEGAIPGLGEVTKNDEGVNGDPLSKSDNSSSNPKKNKNIKVAMAILGLLAIVIVGVGGTIYFSSQTSDLATNQDTRSRASGIDNCCGQADYGNCSSDDQWTAGYYACSNGSCSACRSGGSSSCSNGGNPCPAFTCNGKSYGADSCYVGSCSARRAAVGCGGSTPTATSTPTSGGGGGGSGGGGGVCAGLGGLNQTCRVPQNCNNLPNCNTGLVCDGGVCKTPATGACGSSGRCMVYTCTQCSNYGGGLDECRENGVEVPCNSAALTGCGQIDFLDANGNYCGVKQQACTGSCAGGTAPATSTSQSSTAAPTTTSTAKKSTTTTTTTPTPTLLAQATPTTTVTESAPTQTPTTAAASTSGTCKATCSSNTDCSENLICSGGMCRAQNCLTDDSCTCAAAATTATATPTQAVSTSSGTLPEAGYTWPTIGVLLLGVVMLVLGVVMAI